jgi:DNA-binding NarL/FixJ family response regulator
MKQPTLQNGRARVLIAADDFTTAPAVPSVLTRKGFEVSNVATLADELEALAPAPDYIVLDLSLPDSDGAAVLRRVQRRNLPARVIVATAVNDADRLRDVQALAPHRMLRKAIDLVDLLSAIEKM